MAETTSQDSTRKDAPYSLLSRKNCAFLLVDYQPLVAITDQSMNVNNLKNNALGLAKTAKLFDIPTVLTTFAARTLAGSLFQDIQRLFPNQEPFDRTSFNALDDKRVAAEVKKLGRQKLVVAGLGTDACVAMTVISALREGYQVYLVTDASSGTSYESNERAIQRMVQAGAVPVTWMQVLFEIQRDLESEQSCESAFEIAEQHGGAFGLSILYASEMLGAGTSTTKG